MRGIVNARIVLLAGGLLLGLCPSHPASAAVYRVTTAEKDPDVAIHSGGQALWLPDNDAGTQIPNGNRSGFEFIGDTGRMEVSDDLTTAHLTGTIRAMGDAASAWDVQVTFILGMDYDTFAHGHTDPFGGTHNGRIFRALQPGSYADQGGPVDPATWRYFYLDESRATLTGAAGGGYQGVILDLFQRPNDADFGKFIFQLGVGANGANLNPGFSGWLGYASRPGQDALPAFFGIGDINVDLEPITQEPTIPEPATATLFLAGLTLLSLNARRRQA